MQHPANVDLVVAADATPSTGAGHAMRCAALAVAWQRMGLGQMWFTGEITIPFVRDHLRMVGVIVDDAPASSTPRVLVVDTYDAAKRYQFAQWHGFSVRVLVEDVGGSLPAGYDIVWNPNPYGHAGLYSGFTGSLIAGHQFVPLRPDLPRWEYAATGWTGIMLGGGEITASVLEVVTALPARDSESRFAGVGDWVPSSWQSVESRNPWAWLARCDRLVTASGTAVWEAAYVGVPVVVLKTASNQKFVLEWARRGGVPTLNMLAGSGSLQLTEALRRVLPSARPLPHVANGSERVARTLHQFAMRQDVL
jgi:spore coat polysaccharide biosynthesis predicted glycosyltransferase SpsG